MKNEEEKNQENKVNTEKQDEWKKVEVNKKQGFFKKVWYSIVKIEKYPDMASRGIGVAIGYLVKIVAIIAIVFCLGTIYQTHNLIQEGIKYLQSEFPDFSYKDGILTVEGEDAIIVSEENDIVGKVIVDTNAEQEAKINQNINAISEAGEGVLVLKDRIIVKSSNVAGTISYYYKEMFQPFEINEFKKQDVINYATSGQIFTLYISIFLTMFIYAFIMYFLTTLSNTILLSAFGYITALLARIKMRYTGIFNMSVYALTLSTILNMLYIAINFIVPFNVEYFQVMYVAVAAIYLVAAILILKTDIIKQQMELMKIMEAEELVKKELAEKERKEKEEKEREEQKRKEQEKSDKKKKENDKKKKEKKEDKLNGEEPEGSNA